MPKFIDLSGQKFGRWTVTDRAEDRFTKSGARLTMWSGMVNRCYNQHNKCYQLYGARGISVCEEWKSDYMMFKKWALESGYDETAGYGECTLDRIDNSKGYAPDNCRWVNAEEQANNRRSNIIITAFGKTQNLLAWAKETGINYGTLRTRIITNKWNVEKALTAPVRGW